MSADENTRFIIKRMDALEHRIMDKIEDLQGFKNRVMGVALVCGGLGSFIVEVILNKLL